MQILLGLGLAAFISLCLSAIALAKREKEQEGTPLPQNEFGSRFGGHGKA